MKTNRSFAEHVKAIVYSENAQILILANYLQKVRQKRTAGNPGRHPRQKHILLLRGVTV